MCLGCKCGRIGEPSATLYVDLMVTRVRLGELLVNAKLITPADLELALADQQATGDRLGTILVRRGLLSESQVTQILSQQLSIPWVSLHHIDWSQGLLSMIPAELACEMRIVPVYVRHVRRVGDVLYVAMEDPSVGSALQEISTLCGLRVRPMIAAPSDIMRVLAAHYGLQLPDAHDDDDDRVTMNHRAPAKPSQKRAEESRNCVVLTTDDGREVVIEADQLAEAFAVVDVPGIQPAHLQSLCTALLRALQQKGVIVGWEFASLAR